MFKSIKRFHLIKFLLKWGQCIYRVVMVTWQCYNVPPQIFTINALANSLNLKSALCQYRGSCVPSPDTHSFIAFIDPFIDLYTRRQWSEWGISAEVRFSIAAKYSSNLDYPLYYFRPHNRNMLCCCTMLSFSRNHHNIGSITVRTHTICFFDWTCMNTGC